MKPEERIVAYLTRNKSKVEMSTMDLVIKDVKLSVFYSMPPISDEEIRKIIAQWASIYAIGLLIGPVSAGNPGPPDPNAPKSNSDSELLDAVKKAMTFIANPVTIGKPGANVKLEVTGLTANLKGSDSSATLGMSWTGTLKLEAKSGPFHFVGTLSKDEWQMTLSFPQDTYIPNVATLGKVFSEGERAVWKMADATRGFSKISDAGKIGAVIKPHAAALESAVEAVSGIASANKKGGPSFGFKVGSPEPGPGEQGMPKGVQGMLVFTYVF